MHSEWDMQNNEQNIEVISGSGKSTKGSKLINDHLKNISANLSASNGKMFLAIKNSVKKCQAEEIAKRHANPLIHR